MLFWKLNYLCFYSFSFEHKFKLPWEKYLFLWDRPSCYIAHLTGLSHLTPVTLHFSQQHSERLGLGWLVLLYLTGIFAYLLPQDKVYSVAGLAWNLWLSFCLSLCNPGIIKLGSAHTYLYTHLQMYLDVDLLGLSNKTKRGWGTINSKLCCFVLFFPKCLTSWQWDLNTEQVVHSDSIAPVESFGYFLFFPLKFEWVP